MIALNDIAWRRRRRTQQINDPYLTTDAAAGAAATSMFPSPGRAIFVGTATGVLVWFLTRTLERLFPK